MKVAIGGDQQSRPARKSDR